MLVLCLGYARTMFGPCMNLVSATEKTGIHDWPDGPTVSIPRTIFNEKLSVSSPAQLIYFIFSWKIFFLFLGLVLCYVARSRVLHLCLSEILLGKIYKEIRKGAFSALSPRIVRTFPTTASVANFSQSRTSLNRWRMVWEKTGFSIKVINLHIISGDIHIRSQLTGLVPRYIFWSVRKLKHKLQRYYDHRGNGFSSHFCAFIWGVVCQLADLQTTNQLPAASNY